MKSVPVPLAGPKGGHRSTQFSGEVLHNLYLDEANGRWGAHDFPGLKTLGSQTGADRGAHVMSGVLYRVCGSGLYKVGEDGTHTLMGSVAGTTERCIFADDGSALYFTVAGGVYKYSGGTISAVSQTVVSRPHAIAYINRQFILAGDSGLFAVSDAGDGSTYNALNFAEAEVAPDALWRPYVFSQFVYMLGAGTTEIWYNSGVGNPPFDRQDSSLVNVGIAGRFAVTNTDQHLYWLGDDRKVYQCIGASAQNVASLGFSTLVESFADVSDCIVSSCVVQGQDFVIFQFPSANHTLAYSEKNGYWLSLGSDSEYPGNRWYGNQVLRCYEKNIVVGDGAVYDLDVSTYEDGGDPRIRVRVIPPITGALIGHNGRVTVGRMRINMEEGQGLPTGQGSAPVIMCQWSPDAGKTWMEQVHVPIGIAGDYVEDVDFWQFCTGKELTARIQCTDPVYFSLIDSVVEMRPAGY